MAANTNLRTKDGANQDRYISAWGSGINASPTVIGHTIVTDTGESGIVVAATSSIRTQLISAGVTEVQQLSASALKATAEVYQATASALQTTATQSTNASGWTVRVVTPSGDTAMSAALSAVRVTPATVFDVIQGTASALNATVTGTVTASPNNFAVRIQDSAGLTIQSGASDPVNTDRAIIVRNIPSGSQAITVGVVDVKQTTASALQATVTQSATASGWTVRVVTPSGDTAMDTGLSALRTYLVGGSNGRVEVGQSNASALRGTMEVYQANGSALKVSGEVQQLAASALKATAEVYQATASALNAQVVGELAHDAVDAGNPIKVGGKALEASPANVAHLDRTNAYFDKAGRQFVRTGNQSQDQWTATCIPANTTIRATAVKAAGTSTTRNVCTGFTVTLLAGSVAPTASYFNVVLLDGPSGTNVLWGATLGVPATAGATIGINRTGLWIKSSQASALTLEFSGSPGANIAQSVSMEGTTIAE